MAISSIGSRGTGLVGSSAAASVALTPTATVAAGRVLIVTVVSNSTVTHDSVTDSQGNAYSLLAEASGNGQRVTTWHSKLATQLTTSNSITCNLSGSVSDSLIGAWEFSVATGYRLKESTAEQTNTGTGTGFGSLAFSSLPSVQRLYFRGLGKAANSTTGITATTNFTSTAWTTRTRNNTNARIIRGEFRVNTSTGETSNPTLAVSGNYASTFVALEEELEPVPAELDAAADGSATAAGSLTTAVALAAAPTAPAAAAGALTTAIPLEAGVSASAASSGVLAEPVVTTALGGVDANADKLAQKTDLPASLLAAYSITGWFKRTSNSAEGGPVCVWNGSSYNTILVTTGGMARVGSNLGGVDVASITLDEWYFFALTQSGATRQLKGYVAPSGGSLSSATHTSVNDAATVTDIIVGGGPYFGQQLRGSLTEFRVWTQELSQSELEAEMASHRSPASTSSLVGHYPLVDADTKLDALVGADLQTTGSGAWTTDPDGPFAAGGGSAAQLEAAIATSAGATASLTTAIRPAAALTGAASASGQLTTSLSLASPVAASGAVTGQLTTGIALAAATSATASVAGELDAPVPVLLEGALACGSAASAILETAIRPAAAIVAGASGAASLTTSVSLAGALAAGLGAAASITTSLRLAAPLGVSADAAGSLTTAVALAAGASFSSVGAGALTTTVRLAGALAASATAAGEFQGAAAQLAGAVTASGTAAASISTAITLGAGASAGTSASAVLSSAVALVGGGEAVGIASGDLLTAVALAGAGAATAALAAELTEVVTFGAALECSASLTANLRLVAPRYAVPSSQAGASVAGGLAGASVPGRQAVTVALKEASASVTTPTVGATP